jgi:hypothetical protein
MTRQWTIWTLVVLTLALGGLVALYFAVIGLPTTPMTASHAEALFGQIQPGTSAESVKAWLSSRGIPARSPSPQAPCYDVHYRNEDDQIGNKTPADWAGLRKADVAWYIRVEYPDAQRWPLLNIRIIAYLFFDHEDRLIKTWVEEEHDGL